MNIIKNIWNKIITINDEEIRKPLQQRIQKQQQIIQQLQTTIQYREKIIKQLQKELTKKQEPSKEEQLKKYWQNKIPHNNTFRYKGRKFLIDPRILFTPIDNSLPTIHGKNNDEIALNSLKWVKMNINYSYDKNVYGENEWWAFAYETLNNKKGDCDSQSILLANILLHNGVPAWRVRIVAGDVKYRGKTAGHCWVTYLKEENNKWYVLDATYYFNSNGKLWKRAEKYIDTWFSFDTENIYIKDKMDR